MPDSPAPASAPVSNSTKFFYGIGSVAFGVKDNGFSFFLLFYYNQVLGLPHSWVGAGIMVTLLLDAISDPLVGYLSDNWHSRWGRRHPFMYFSAVPVGIGFWFLFSPPPGLTPGWLFAWFLGFAVLVRTLITFYEIPSSSLVAELTDDYDQRTSMMSFRYFFGWIGGLSMSVMAYSFFFQPTAQYPNGQLNPAGYQLYAMACGAVITLAILVSAIGTHRHIPTLKAPPPKQAFDRRRVLGEFKETLGNHSFLMLFFAGIFAATAAGLSAALNIYFNTYFWELTASQISALMLSVFVAAFVGLLGTPVLAARLGKKRAALLTAGSAVFFAPMAVVGRLLGWMPENGSDALVPALMVFGIIDVSLIIMAGILVSSMVADIVEESEMRTGRRSEGTFFAARSFAQKAVSGIGVWVSTGILAFVAFPEDAVPGQVPEAVLRDLALTYLPIVAILYLIFLGFLASYRISRESHGENLRTLSDRKAA
ncbi:MAG: MFS transporter [Deltaproteobacteria bacterium]